MKPRVKIRGRRVERGFTLVEMIAVITILGVLSALGAQALGRPMVALVSTATQARFADMLDLAVDRVSRDVRLAVPRSLRVLDSNRLSLDRTLATRVPSGHGGLEERERIAVTFDPSRRGDPPPLRGAMEAWIRPEGLLARLFG